jgi:hypothetical protein
VAAHDGDFDARDRGFHLVADQVLAEDLPVQVLRALELPFKLALALRAHDPDFAWIPVAGLSVLPDAHQVVLGVRPHPDVRGAEDGLRAQGGAGEDDLLVRDRPGWQDELEGNELEDLGGASLLDVGLRLVDRDGARHGAEGSVVRLLDEVALVLEPPELPLDEPPVPFIDGGAVAALVDEEAELLPVVVRVDAREVVDDAPRLRQGREGAIVAVGAQVLGLLAALDFGGKRDGRDAGRVKTRGIDDVVARHPLVARKDVGVGEAPHVSDVEEARDPGVGEMDEERGLAQQADVPSVRGALPPRRRDVGRPIRVVDLGIPPALLPLRRDSGQVPILHQRAPRGRLPKKVGGRPSGRRAVGS